MLSLALLGCDVHRAHTSSGRVVELGTTEAAGRCGAMPRFYLHVSDGKLFAEDHEGLELHDIEAARREAIVGLRDVMADELKHGQINMAAFVEVEDENHQLVMTVPFLDAVEVLTQHHRRPKK